MFIKPDLLSFLGVPLNQVFLECHAVQVILEGPAVRVVLLDLVDRVLRCVLARQGAQSDLEGQRSPHCTESPQQKCMLTKRKAQSVLSPLRYRFGLVRRKQ